MSHSRIFIIDENAYVDADDIFEIMESYDDVDYVQDSDLDEDIKWLHDSITTDDIGIVPTERGFKIVDKDKFRKAMEKSDGDDCFWFYADGCMSVLAEIVEEAENGKEFVVYNSFDYHF